MATKKTIAEEKKSMELVRKALEGDLKAIAEFDRIHGKGEFNRRCEMLLRAIFEAPAPKKQVKGKAVPEMGLGYGTGIKNMKKAVATGKKPATAADKRAVGKPVAKKPAAPKKAGVAKTAKITRTEADAAKPNVPQAAKDPAALPASVRITDKEVELHLGSFGVRQLAEHDASELLGHPMVFWYRRGVFPDPRQAKVNPTVIEAKVVERKGASFKGAPFTVHVKIGMAGDAVHCLAWAKGVYSRNKGEQE